MMALNEQLEELVLVSPTGRPDHHERASMLEWSHHPPLSSSLSSTCILRCIGLAAAAIPQVATLTDHCSVELTGGKCPDDTGLRVLRQE